METQIIQDFIPVGRRNRPGYTLKPRFVTIHDTANTQSGADAKAHAAYIKGDDAANRPVSWHFTVDDGNAIYQHLPLNENGWHAGDGFAGTGNRESIGIEICENRGIVRATAELKAAWLTAKMLKTFGLDVGAVVQHHKWNGKGCPRVLRGRVGGWEGFLNEVARQRALLEEPPTGGDFSVEIGALQERTTKLEKTLQEAGTIMVGWGNTYPLP